MVRIESGSLKMNAGSTIIGNASCGVSIRGGTFTMSGGIITGNTASENGGGVYNNRYGSFKKIGGTITGYNSDQANGNVVKDEEGVIARKGHAVYVTSVRKETTAGPEVNLYDENGKKASGAWDD